MQGIRESFIPDKVKENAKEQVWPAIVRDVVVDKAVPGLGESDKGHHKGRKKEIVESPFHIMQDIEGAF